MCNIFNCEKRHPKVCSWFQKYGRFNLQLIANSNIKISNTLMEQLMRKFVITFIILTIMQNSFNNRDCKERSIISHDCSARWARFSLAFLTNKVTVWTGKYRTCSWNLVANRALNLFFHIINFLFLRSAQLLLMNIPYHFALNWCLNSFS